MNLLGLDIGSSSIKASLLNGTSGKIICQYQLPDKEMPMIAHKPGWAEQEPELWWQHVQSLLIKIKSDHAADMAAVEAIGISYQMHGLVCVDKKGSVLRPSIIWCDSRAVEIGNQAQDALGKEYCLKNYLNSPGNFTASKLAWVKKNEPDVFKKIDKIMLPGDYIAFKLTGKIQTTVSGLSEGIFWDFNKEKPAEKLLEYYGIDKSLLPEIVPVFSTQATLTKENTSKFGLPITCAVAYRAGDQPNNALSLSVLEPGEVAATGGTSGVVYGISEDAVYDKKSRVNTFAHVNHSDKNPHYGVLLCINGTGILNSYLKNTLFNGAYSYDEMNNLASQIPPGSAGLKVYPFGNGAERVLENKLVGATMLGLSFNTHSQAHIIRAVQEGIAFGFIYGMEIMEKIGVKTQKIRAGKANLFLSPVFRSILANAAQASIELYDTDGATGAARGAGLGIQWYKSAKDAFASLQVLEIEKPDKNLVKIYKELYQNWRETLIK